MAEPVARSPVRPAPPVTIAHGWEVSAKPSSAPLRLVDCTPLAKVAVRAPAGGRQAAVLGVRHGQAARADGGVLVAGTGPGEWLLVGPHGAPAETVAARAAGAVGDELVTVLDVTHGRCLLRLWGPDAAGALAKVCAVDLGDGATPDGTALRTTVAGLVAEVVRDDHDGTRSFLLACDREAGQYLCDVLLDAGAEFAIDVEGLGASAWLMRERP